jgi:hypothetical protein
LGSRGKPGKQPFNLTGASARRIYHQRDAADADTGNFLSVHSRSFVVKVRHQIVTGTNFETAPTASLLRSDEDDHKDLRPWFKC